MSLSRIFLITLLSIATFSCSTKDSRKSIKVINTLNTERTFETIELTKDFLKIEDLKTIGIQDSSTDELLVTQMLDINGDGEIDQLLFQPQLKANTEKTYYIVSVTEDEKPKSIEYCYSRFVPERIDDYTWENDKVAFRVYGPTAQKMVEDKIKGGTLSSGVDAWLKKVDYPIINKWYKETTEGTGSYHKDTGEGLDDFHVGSSRGVGGIGYKKGNQYIFSKNYTAYKTISTGPIRTSFYLNYEDWGEDGTKVQESRVISLDRGSHFSKFTISLKGIDTISAGLTLHEKDGDVSGDKEKGWVSYWQPHAESELGTAIIAAANSFLGFEKHDVEAKDLSNAYAHLKIKENRVVYYTGFAWKEAGQITTKEEWESYLNEFSNKVNNPLIFKLIN
jgi:hypothetical protein